MKSSEVLNRKLAALDDALLAAPKGQAAVQVSRKRVDCYDDVFSGTRQCD